MEVRVWRMCGGTNRVSPGRLGLWEGVETVYGELDLASTMQHNARTSETRSKKGGKTTKQAVAIVDGSAETTARWNPAEEHFVRERRAEEIVRAMSGEDTSS